MTMSDAACVRCGYTLEAHVLLPAHHGALVPVCPMLVWKAPQDAAERPQGQVWATFAVSLGKGER